MGGGGTADADLSHGAVAAMLRVAEGLRPVLQVADVTRQAPLVPLPLEERYNLVLSDGVHSLPGVLVASLRGLVRDGELRRGTMVRVLRYIRCDGFGGPSIIAVIKLEVLQMECALIGCPTVYEANPTQTSGGSCSYGVGSHDHESCFRPGAQKVADNLSCSPVQDTTASSFAPRAEHAVHYLKYGGCYGSILPDKTLDTKMQELSLDDHQNKRFPATSPVGDFGTGTSGSPLPPLSKLPSPMCTGGTLDAKMQELSLDDQQNKRFPVITTVENFGIGSTSGSPLPPLSLLSSPMSKDRSCVAMNEAPCLVACVSALNSYTHRWKIKGRVTSKNYLRQYRIFSCDLIDAQGGEIRARCINPCKADQFFDLIEVDKVYMISGVRVKHLQNRYCPLNDDYEISVDDPTSVEVCSDDDSSIPTLSYNFRKIKEIGKLENGSLVDLLGVVTSVSPSATMMWNNRIGTSNRKVLLKDMSDRSVEITLWGMFCDKGAQQLQCLLESGSNPILAVKRCRISGIIGISLATISCTHIKVNPDLPEAERLRQWYLTEGKTAACISLSRSFAFCKTIAQIKDACMGQSVMPASITIRATISHVSTICYPACSLEFNGKQCNRKVNKNNDGAWNCSRCMVDLPKCEYRYLLMCQLQDRTGVTYATAFQEAGTKIIGYSAEELSNLRDQDEAKCAEILLGVCRQEYIFKLNIEEETLHGETCVKWSTVGADKVRRMCYKPSSLKRGANSLGMGLETVRYRLRT